MSDVKANSYISPVIGKIPKMIAKAKQLENLAREFAKKKEIERARIAMLKSKGVEITDSMVMAGIKFAYAEDDAMKEVARIKNNFHKIELDAYNKREIISRADGALQAKLKKAPDDGARYFSSIDFRR